MFDNPFLNLGNKDPEFVDLPYLGYLLDQIPVADDQPLQKNIEACKEQYQQLSIWLEWAKEKIHILRETLRTEQEEVGKLRTKTDEQQTTINKQEEAINGLSTTLELRNSKSVQAYELGTNVIIGRHNQEGTISGVYITEAGIRYEVEWWNNSEFTTQLLPTREIKPVEDLLIPPL